MKSLFFLTFLFIYSCVLSQEVELKLKKGDWISKLIISEQDVLPFKMKVEKSGDIKVINSEEEITLEKAYYREDSFVVRFPYFNSQLVFSVQNKKQIRGYWQNFNKGAQYKIPFISSFNKKGARFSENNRMNASFSAAGRWKVTFEPGTEFEYPAVGIFNSIGENKLSGTFLTETGDYRFLEGNSYGDSLFLSCFDGSHAFLFKALYKNDSLKGSFFSGNHWSCDWEGVKNDSFEIRNPEELTYLKPEQKIEFNFKSVDGSDFYYPNDQLKNKVVIIQIMGSWCPNCLDETVYYKTLFETYHNQGLEIISIGYESGEGFEDYVKNINRLKKKLDLDFHFLVGGPANKNKASEDFNMLNAIISFPTSIFIGKDGKVKRIHTGFNGPGTGKYYSDYIKRTEALVERLLNQ